MRSLVISDSSSLILFDQMGKFELLLKVYDVIFTTRQVAFEFGGPLPELIQIKKAKDKEYLAFLEMQFDWDVASAIALAKEVDNSILLLDDLKARKLAAQLNLKFTGTLGVLHTARQLGYVDKIEPLIDKLLKENFRIPENIVLELLKINNEIAV